VPENEILWGSPANQITFKKKIDISSRQLPELLKRVKSLEKEIEELKKQLAR
jgi:septal ring factor EnvC (AmiA/AmiB activator)